MFPSEHAKTEHSDTFSHLTGHKKFPCGKAENIRRIEKPHVGTRLDTPADTSEVLVEMHADIPQVR